MWGCLFKRWRRDTSKQLTIPEALNWIIRRIDRIEHKLNRLLDKQEKSMADAAAILAKVRANTDVLNSVAIAADALNEGQADIASLIADLKAQIAAGQAPDLTELEAAVDTQSQVIAGVKSAVGENTAG